MILFVCGAVCVVRGAWCFWQAEMWQQLIGGGDEDAFEMWKKANTQVCLHHQSFNMFVQHTPKLCTCLTVISEVRQT